MTNIKDTSKEAPETRAPTDAEPSRPGKVGIRSMQGVNPETPPETDAAALSDQQRIDAAMAKLDSSAAGQPIASTIRDTGTTIDFGPLASGALARYYDGPNHIRINETQKDDSPEVHAALLAHEGTHAQHRFVPNSVDQELACHMNEAKVWREVKGNQQNEEFDSTELEMSRSERSARAYIRSVYGTTFPEHAQF